MEMREPSVLDYVKALLTPWKGKIPAIPAEENGETQDVLNDVPEPKDLEFPLHEEEAIPAPKPGTLEKPTPQSIIWPWRSLAALGLALAAQQSMEPGANRLWEPGVVLYLFAAVMVLWAFLSQEWLLQDVPDGEPLREKVVVHHLLLWLSVLLALMAFLMFGGNRFTSFNVTVWVAAITAFAAAFWVRDPEKTGWLRRLSNQIRRPEWRFTLTPWMLLVAGSILLSIFFRTYQFTEVTPEMTSDHAEKLLDVGDILRGETSIFFVRNTGREPLQMYMTAAVAKLFGTGLSFNSLKIGTILAGLLTLPFIYLLGVEVANKRAGLLAMTFAGIAYWPNVISRASLRFTLYPLSVAATLYFLIRGIRRSSMNDFIIAGIMLGIGLHGYTPVRILPVVVILAVSLFLIHRHSRGHRQETLWRLAILATVGFMIFLPLLRYWVSDPDLFVFRALTRMSSLERPIPGAPIEIFLKNLWNALTMFSWDNGRVWLVSVMNRPALDVVSGALFHIGIILLLIRYIRRHHWVDLFLLLAIPMLMLPSILSLAFPEENPVLNRTSGALVLVFLIVGITLDSLISTLKFRLRSPSGTPVLMGLGVILLAWSAGQNYDLVFNQYKHSYSMSSWNTTELGSVIRNFSESIGNADSAYVVPYPHWVDTRLVGVNAGVPTKDYALWPQDFHETVGETRAKMFLINPNDHESIEALQQLYPQGWLKRYISRYPDKSFYIFIVPPQGSRSEIPSYGETIID